MNRNGRSKNERSKNERSMNRGSNGGSQSGLSDPTRLASMDQDDDSLVQVVIETPKGSRNKYAFDPEQKVFELKKVLPAGMAFPYDFGFVPRTKSGGWRSYGCPRTYG